MAPVPDVARCVSGPARSAGQRAVALAAALALAGCVSQNSGPAAPRTITVTSPAIQAGQAIPVRFSCAGASLSPPLAWTGAPEKTVELAVVVDDPDAPDPPFTHWIVVGLAPTVTGLTEGQLPADAVQLPNSTGRASYQGMCPPLGQRHTYRFTIEALSRRPAFDPNESPARSRAAIDAAALARGTLLASFQR